MRKNKGFTLVEMIVAFVVSGVLATSVAGLVILTINNYMTTKNEAQVQLEGQTISEYLKSLLHGCEGYYLFDSRLDVSDFSGDFECIVIQTRKHQDFRSANDDNSDVSYDPVDGYYFFAIDDSDNSAYLYFDSMTFTDSDGKLVEFDDLFIYNKEEDKIYIKDDYADSFNELIEEGIVFDDMNYLGQYTTDIDVTPGYYSYNSSIESSDFNYNIVMTLVMSNGGFNQEVTTNIDLRSK